MDLSFTKLHGNGNDFILIDEYKGELIPGDMKASFASVYCDRRFGIGADGVLFLGKGKTTDLSMRLFQPDESEAEMCGNGIRCLIKYAADAGYIRGACTVDTPAGAIRVSMGVDDDGDFYAEVEMNTPQFNAPEIPAKGSGDFHEIINGYEVYAVNTGVPHAVIFVKDIEMAEIMQIAPPIRHSQYFPKGANVNLVQVVDRENIRIRTFERGVEGETLSCGTGATASAAIAHRIGKTDDVVEVETIGGPLMITLTQPVRMRGPADTVFTGRLSL